jgi:2-polyprenyl-3-methyl-5-hydroxy-6-metoxy-1,4-benzoquinol methylase
MDKRYEALIKTGECMVPGETACDPRDLLAHLSRYRWAQDFCRGKEVLDAACGCGYGTKIIAKVATSVHGIDNNAAAIQYAWEHYKADNNGFEERSVYAVSRIKASFDVVVSFETIEHLRRPERFVRQVYDLLHPGALFIVSAPQSGEVMSEWHFWDFTKEALAEVLATSFDMTDARYFVQNLGDEFTEDGEIGDIDFPTHIYVVKRL